MKYKISLIFIFLLLFLQNLLGVALNFRRTGAVLPSGAANYAFQKGGNGAELLKLYAVFENENSRRACWDFPLKGDLTHCSGVKLTGIWRNVHAAGVLTAHFRLDDCWYSAKFMPRGTGEWEQIFIPKSDFIPENERVSSWRKCTMMRIAAWRGANGTMEAILSSIELVAPNASVAMLRCTMTSGANPKLRQENIRYCKWFQEMMVAGGIYPAVIDECDVTFHTLDKYRMVAVPHLGGAGDGTVERLERYLETNGRLMLFHDVPETLCKAMKIPKGRYLAASALRVPLEKVQTTGGLSFRQMPSGLTVIALDRRSDYDVIGWWMDSHGARTPYPAMLKTPFGIWMSAVFRNHDVEKSAAVMMRYMEEYVPHLRRSGMAELIQGGRVRVLATADANKRQASARWLKRMQECSLKGDYIGVLESRRNLVDCLESAKIMNDDTGPMLPPRKNELRGAWVRNAEGYHGRGWMVTAQCMKNYGLNVVFPLMLTPYSAGFPSTVVRSSGTSGGRDNLGDCLKTCHQMGIAVHGWVQVLGLGDAPEPMRKVFSAQGRLQRRINGEEIPWLCPSDDRNVKMMENAVTEMCRRYPDLDGVNLDMARFEGSLCCYCRNCLQKFSSHLGKTPRNWPLCTKPGQALHGKWVEFRKLRIAKIVEVLARAARCRNKKLLVSVAVYPELESAIENVGQDWPDWLEHHSVNFVSPMNYCRELAELKINIERQKKYVGEAMARGHMCPALGWTAVPLDDMALKRQINAVRAEGLPGFVLFELK